MRSEIINQLNSDIDYYYYLRENPVWQKILTIHPDKLKDFIQDYKIARKKRVIDRIDDVNNLITIAEAFLKK